MAFLADQATKIFFFNDRLDGASVIPGVLDFILHRNEGISFNIPIPIPLILAVTGLVLTGIIVFLIKNPRAKPLTVTGLALIFGGAIGNAFDRTVLGFVRDWLLLFGRSAVNFADAAIVIGVVTFLLTERNRAKSLDNKE